MAKKTSKEDRDRDADSDERSSSPAEVEDERADADPSEEGEAGADGDEPDGDEPDGDEPDGDEPDGDEPIEARGASDSDDEEERDETAEGVAKALGVDEDDESAADGAEAPKNRALRRREEVERRRKRRVEAELPKDRNKRAKELLARRRREAEEEEGGDAPHGLTAGEIVNDNLSRAASGLGKWLRNNLSIVQYALAGGLVVAGGLIYYFHTEEEKSGEVSSVLAKGLEADLAPVIKDDTRTEEEKKASAQKVFTSPAERRETALAAYNQVVDGHAGTGPAILAKLGQAGMHLEQRNWDAAQTAFEEVVGSSLAGADDSVKGNAVEGLGFVLEGKGDFDAAMSKFKELQGIEGFDLLGQFHQARMLLAKGEKEQAKQMLVALRTELEKPSLDGKPDNQYLKSSVDETLREIDPSAVPRAKSLGGPKGASMTDEEIQALLERARKQAEEKAAHGGEGEEAPPGMPGLPPGMPMMPGGPDAPPPEPGQAPPPGGDTPPAPPGGAQ